MAEHRRRTAAAALCMVAGGLAGCDSDEPPAESPAASPAPTEVGETPLAIRDSSSASAEAARCVRSERNAARGYWTWRVVDDVAESPVGHSDRARAAVERFVESTRTRLHERCGRTSPPAFREFSRDIKRVLARDAFGHPQLDRVLAAWSHWGAAVGEPRAARRTIREVRSCRNLFARFDATYRTWWRWTTTGKAWWIDITFENRTDKLLGGSTWGRAKVTEMLQESFGPRGAPGPTRVVDAMLQSGASSSDSFNAPTGTSVWRVPMGDPDVYTTATGTLHVTEMALYLFSLDGRHTCHASVPPAP